jgi:hypothetical protein
VSHFPHAISPPDTSFPDHPFNDDAEQCACMTETDHRDEQWQPLEAQDDGDAVRVRCRCRTCGRVAWLETFQRICAWCKCELPGHDRTAKRTSHGMCHSCAKEWVKE